MSSLRTTSITKHRDCGCSGTTRSFSFRLFISELSTQDMKKTIERMGEGAIGRVRVKEESEARAQGAGGSG